MRTIEVYIRRSTETLYTVIAARHKPLHIKCVLMIYDFMLNIIIRLMIYDVFFINSTTT